MRSEVGGRSKEKLTVVSSAVRVKPVVGWGKVVQRLAELSCRAFEYGFACNSIRDENREDVVGTKIRRRSSTVLADCHECHDSARKHLPTPRILHSVPETNAFAARLKAARRMSNSSSTDLCGGRAGTAVLPRYSLPARLRWLSFGGCRLPNGAMRRIMRSTMP